MPLDGSLFDRVVGVLTPYLGQHTARASVEMYCKQVNVEAAALATGDLERLADKLRPGLKVFIGAAKADAIVLQVKGLGL